MRRALLLLLILLAAPTFYADQNVTIDGHRFNTSVIQDEALVMVGSYYTLILREGRCSNKDIYLFCLENLTKDIVDFWPHEYEIVLNWTQLCTDCKSYGEACEARVDCSGHCVHEVCRPRATWCGDGFCDDNEHCSTDCEEPVDEPVPEENASEDETVTNGSIESSDNLTATVNDTVENLSAVQEPETAPQVQSAPAAAGPDTNWTGVGITIGGGVLLLVFIFGRKKKEPEIL